MKRVKRIEWNNVSLVVDVAVCIYFAGFIARFFVKAHLLLVFSPLVLDLELYLRRVSFFVFSTNC